MSSYRTNTGFVPVNTTTSPKLTASGGGGSSPAPFPSHGKNNAVQDRIKEGLDLMTAEERASFLEQMTHKMKGQEFHDPNYRDNYLVGIIDRWIRQKKEDEIMEYEVI